MTRITCSMMALLLLVMSGGAAARMCACLDAVAAPSCCEQKMPCCDGSGCDMHPEQQSREDLALDLFKAVDFVYALPSLRTFLLQPKVEAPAALHVPLVTRVRGPDQHAHALRAPPAQA